MAKLRLGGHTIQYEVTRSTSAKYVRLRFKRNKVLVITLPTGMEVDAVIRKKRAWIERKFHELQQRKRIFNGKHLLYKGEYYKLRRISLRSERVQVEIVNGKMVVPAERTTDAQQKVREWMTQETFSFVTSKAQSYAKELGVTLGALHIRDTKRWGYCTRSRDLVFNWQLIALPVELAEYVVLHEVTHLSSYNHSRGFRIKLAALCPDYAEKEKSLKRFITGEVTDLKL